MKKIKLTQGKTALIDNEDYEAISAYKWFFNNGYAGRRNGGDRIITKSITMHRAILNPAPDLEVDHINGNRLDNRRQNLRICTRQQNMMNKRPYKNKTSKYKGVCWNKVSGKFIAHIRNNGKFIYIGQSDNQKELALKYDKVARELYGEYAWLNFPKVINS